jgi:hypothetical protein
MKKLPVVRLCAFSLFALAGVAGASAATTAQLAGDAVPPAEGQRTVLITPDTRWINVEHDEMVKFESQGQSFAFDFDGLYDRSYDLAALAPQGMVDHPVRVYVQRRLDDTDLN